MGPSTTLSPLVWRADNQGLKVRNRAPFLVFYCQFIAVVVLCIRWSDWIRSAWLASPHSISVITISLSSSLLVHCLLVVAVHIVSYFSDPLTFWLHVAKFCFVIISTGMIFVDREFRFLALRISVAPVFFALVTLSLFFHELLLKVAYSAVYDMLVVKAYTKLHSVPVFLPLLLPLLSSLVVCPYLLLGGAVQLSSVPNSWTVLLPITVMGIWTLSIMYHLIGSMAFAHLHLSQSQPSSGIFFVALRRCLVWNFGSICSAAFAVPIAGLLQLKHRIWVMYGNLPYLLQGQFTRADHELSPWSTAGLFTALASNQDLFEAGRAVRTCSTHFSCGQQIIVNLFTITEIVIVALICGCTNILLALYCISWSYPHGTVAPAHVFVATMMTSFLMGAGLGVPIMIVARSYATTFLMNWLFEAAAFRSCEPELFLKLETIVQTHLVYRLESGQ